MGMDWGDILNIVNILFVDKEISGVGGGGGVGCVILRVIYI